MSRLIKLKNVIAFISAFVFLLNTGSQVAMAIEDSSSSEATTESTSTEESNLGASGEWTPRFPVGRGGNLSGLTGSSGSDKTDDENWVAHKDDDRHGIASGALWAAAVSGAGIAVGGHVGTAKGTYAVKIGDKSYYWYHQSSSCPGCANCGTWTNMRWGSSGRFGADGCAIYSLAIIASNLTGQEITPSKLLTDMGCKINKSGTSCDTSNSGYVANNHNMKLGEDGMGQFLCDTYGLEMETGLGSLSKADCQKKVNEILDKGGMVWYRYRGGSWNPSYYNSHFITIRGYDEDGYYILDEAVKPESIIHTTPISFDTLYNEYYGSYFVGFWTSGAQPKKDSSSNSSGVSSTGNSSAYSMWAGPATQLKQYSNKVDLGNGFYLYDGLPWAAEANTFAVDIDTATIAVEQYVKQVSANKEAKTMFGYMQGDDGNYSAIALLESCENTRMTNTSYRPDNKPDDRDWIDIDGGKYIDWDGVRSIGVGVGPALTDWDYCIDFGANVGGNEIDAPNRWALDYFSRTDLYNARSAIVLYELDTKKLWYLPATACSSKGHSFPGGLIQTGVTVSTYGWIKTPCELDSNGVLSKMIVRRNGYWGGPDHDWDISWLDHGTGDPSEMMDLFNFKSALTYDCTCWDFTASVFECWNVPNCVNSKVIKSGDYIAVGWVHWPTEK